MKLKTLAFLSLLLAFTTDVASANEDTANFDGLDEASIDVNVANSILADELDDMVEGTGLEINNYEVEQQLVLKSDEPGSCTVSATVSLSGVPATTLTATASTCEEASTMIIDGIRALTRQYGSVITTKQQIGQSHLRSVE